jgi:hypothetical protein
MQGKDTANLENKKLFLRIFLVAGEVFVAFLLQAGGNFRDFLFGNLCGKTYLCKAESRWVPTVVRAVLRTFGPVVFLG